MQTVVYYKNNQESNTKFAGLATAVAWDGRGDALLKFNNLSCQLNS